MKLNLSGRAVAVILLVNLNTSMAMAAIALDRTRVIYNAGDKAISLSISNENKQLPFLAQSWLTDEQGEKISSPLMVLPPVQRVEPGERSQIKIQALPAAESLAQDRETLFYFNLREIPPRSDKPNTLQIALQTSIKLFYRPQAIVPGEAERLTPWQQQLTLTRRDDRYQIANPTPYFITLVDARHHQKSTTAAGFAPLMIAPRDKAWLGGSLSSLGSEPVLTYVNDYGGRTELKFRCEADRCRAVVEHK
ncbi:fimbria/pilus periplasmic chaperone [Winslowiella iniecta]|uniref:Molecular chaperone n=1 Tax=Winslowiella iniecta TaxID=1560201 RepID=A0A0L7SWU5_9GAMM|nr:fimbria/pilus periplasmic chaperone [Winslowiella iniecta]KOC87486.1 molecular chaperone [Winslowiella iniecta]KOC87612.1 molecular chaperone [Winslowiella iniecta]